MVALCLKYVWISRFTKTRVTVFGFVRRHVKIEIAQPSICGHYIVGELIDHSSEKRIKMDFSAYFTQLFVPERPTVSGCWDGV